MSLVMEGYVTGTIETGTPVNLTSWTPGANELCICAVSMRKTTVTPTLAGNGLTWVSVASAVNVQNQCAIYVFRAMGASPSAGQIAVTVTGNDKPVSCIAFRLSGADKSGTNGSGAVEASSTDTGPDPDNDDMKLAITTLSANAWAIGCGSHRAKTFSLPAGETAILLNQIFGSSGQKAGCSVWYEPTPTAGAVTVGADADLSSNGDWCMVDLSIKPDTTGAAVGTTDEKIIKSVATDVLAVDSKANLSL